LELICGQEDLIQDFFEVVLDVVDPVVCEDFLQNSASLNYNLDKDICAAKEVTSEALSLPFF
jgi:hypothetical protein